MTYQQEVQEQAKQRITSLILDNNTKEARSEIQACKQHKRVFGYELLTVATLDALTDACELIEIEQLYI